MNIQILTITALSMLGAYQVTKAIPYDNQPFTRQHRHQLANALLTITLLIILAQALS